MMPVAAAFLPRQEFHKLSPELSPNGYRTALLSFSAALDESKQINSPFYSEKTYHIDKALIYHRLARLERETGNLEKVEEYSTLAAANCAKAGWANCSTEKLDEMVEKLELRSLFAQPEKTPR